VVGDNGTSIWEKEGLCDKFSFDNASVRELPEDCVAELPGAPDRIHREKLLSFQPVASHLNDIDSIRHLPP